MAVWVSGRVRCRFLFGCFSTALSPIHSVSLSLPGHPRRTVNTSAETCTKHPKTINSNCRSASKASLSAVANFVSLPAPFHFHHLLQRLRSLPCRPTLNVSLLLLPFRHLVLVNRPCRMLRWPAVTRIPQSHLDTPLSDPFRCFLRACSLLNHLQTHAGSCVPAILPLWTSPFSASPRTCYEYAITSGFTGSGNDRRVEPEISGRHCKHCSESQYSLSGKTPRVTARHVI